MASIQGILESIIEHAEEARYAISVSDDIHLLRDTLTTCHTARNRVDDMCKALEMNAYPEYREHCETASNRYDLTTWLDMMARLEELRTTKRDAVANGHTVSMGLARSIDTLEEELYT